MLARFEIDGRAVSLVRASPLTGRTHQIRVHMASIGHALLGDDKYLRQPAPSVSRLCLHAWQLNLAGDSDATKQFVADVPSDMANLFPKECEFLITHKKS